MSKLNNRLAQELKSLHDHYNLEPSRGRIGVYQESNIYSLVIWGESTIAQNLTGGMTQRELVDRLAFMNSIHRQLGG